MKQSKLMSFVESVGGTAIGFVVAFFANMMVLPWFGLVPSIGENLLITAIYTVISILRGFGVRRLFEALHIRRPLSPFMQAVIAERFRQIEGEGWSTDHDDRHERGELADAGACYVQCAGVNAAENRLPPSAWPWEAEWWKPVGFRRDLVKGCALIVAEGEKFDRSRKRSKTPRRYGVQGGYVAPPDGSRPIPPRSGSGVVIPLAHNKTASEQGGASA